MGKAEEVKRDRALDELLEAKLNHDGRWWAAEPLPLREAVSRLSTLTQEESDYLGAVMGWQPGFEGIDWEAVPSKVLALAAAGRLLMEDLRALYPAPAATNQEE